MRERLEELLKKAAKVEEALAVERELERVAGELERIKGRLKLLRELVTFSTITVEFQPAPSITWTRRCTCRSPGWTGSGSESSFVCERTTVMKRFITALSLAALPSSWAAGTTSRRPRPRASSSSMKRPTTIARPPPTAW